jgi:hypothetical protein
MNPNNIQTFLPISKCIYCGETKNLSDEHIIPFSLNGKWILPDASCSECAKITSAFEGRVSRMFASFRQSANLKTRRPNKRKKSISLKDDNGNVLEMPNEGMWDTVPTFKFLLPGIYQKDWNVNKGWVGLILGILNKQPNSSKLSHWKKFNTSTLTYQTPEFDYGSYAIMLAKIGHCIAVGHYGIDNFDHFLPQFILGKENANFTNTLDQPNSSLELIHRKLLPESLISLNLSYFVGSFDEILPPELFDHTYSISIQKSDIPGVQYLIYTRIRLFAFSGSPTACVVVGKVNSHNREKCIDNERKTVLNRT